MSFCFSNSFYTDLHEKIPYGWLRFFFMLIIRNFNYFSGRQKKYSFVYHDFNKKRRECFLKEFYSYYFLVVVEQLVPLLVSSPLVGFSFYLLLVVLFIIVGI